MPNPCTAHINTANVAIMQKNQVIRRSRTTEGCDVFTKSSIATELLLNGSIVTRSPITGDIAANFDVDHAITAYNSFFASAIMRAAIVAFK